MALASLLCTNTKSSSKPAQRGLSEAESDQAWIVRKLLIRLLGIQRRNGGVIRHSVDEIARRSRGPRKRRSRAGSWIKKNRQFLCKEGWRLLLFFRTTDQPGWRFSRRRGTGTSALKTGNDSEMAPQAIEIAKNGLGDRRSAPMLEGLLGSEADLALGARRYVSRPLA